MHDQIIYGTYPLQDAELDAAVQHAIAAGFRSFDTAQIYGNEAALGKALFRSGLPRTDFRVTTKISPQHYQDRSFLRSLRLSLRALQLDYVDTVLLHFPPSDPDISHVLVLLASATETGLARSVGISNFTAAQMRQAAIVSPVPLVLNQVEFHPLIDGSKLVAASTDTGIGLQAFSPLARGAALSPPILTEIGRRHGKTAAQVVLRWIMHHGITAVTQSANPAHINSNFTSTGFELTADEIHRIGVLATLNVRLIRNDVIAWAPTWD